MGLLNPPSKFESPGSGTSSTQVSQAPKGNKMSPIATTKVVTGVVRGSFCNIFSPRPQSQEELDAKATPKYGMTVLIPKTDTVTLAKIAAAQEAAVNAKWPNKRPPKLDTTLHDGDGARPSNGEPFGEECKGHMVLSASSKFKPKIIDRDGNEVIDPAQAMSGDYFKVSLNFYGYYQKGKRGTSGGLGNILFWEKGEPLGGSSRAEDDFAADLNS